MPETTPFTPNAAAATHAEGAGYDQLYRQHAARLLGLCERLCGRRDWAEDAAQEAWIAYHRVCDEGRPPADPIGWLIRAASRSCVDLIRSESRRRRRERRAAELDEHRCPRDATDHEALRQALARLPDRYRDPLILRYLDEEDIPTVARRLGCSPGTARVRIHRALARLKPLVPGGAIGALLTSFSPPSPGALAPALPSTLTPTLTVSGATSAGNGLGGLLMTLSLTGLTTAAALAFTLPFTGAAADSSDSPEPRVNAEAAQALETLDRAELVARARQADIARATMHTLNRELEAAEERVRELEAENRRLRTAIQALTSADTGATDQTASTGRHRGTVVAMRPNVEGIQDMVMITLAGAGEIEHGSELIIHRGNTYIAKVRVERTFDDMVKARVIDDSWNPRQDPIRLGDQASAALETDDSEPPKADF